MKQIRVLRRDSSPLGRGAPPDPTLCRGKGVQRRAPFVRGRRASERMDGRVPPHLRGGGSGGDPAVLEAQGETLCPTAHEKRGAAPLSTAFVDGFLFLIRIEIPWTLCASCNDLFARCKHV